MTKVSGAYKARASVDGKPFWSDARLVESGKALEKITVTVPLRYRGLFVSWTKDVVVELEFTPAVVPETERAGVEPADHDGPPG